MRFILLLLAGAALPAHGFVTTPTLVQERLDAATLVAEIVAEDSETTLDTKYGLMTRVTVEIVRLHEWRSETRAMPRAGDRVVVQSPGGERNGVGVVLDGHPRPKKTRHYQAHLKLVAPGEYEVTGFDAGLVPLDGSREYSRNRTDGSNGDGTGPYLYWPHESFPIPYYIASSTFAFLPSFVTAIDESFRTWRSVTETQFEILPMGCTTTVRNENDGINTVILSSTWPFDPAAIAITRNFYLSGDTARSGMILDSDILLNNVNWQFTTTGEPGKHDIQDIVTHEAGHFLGLGHETAPTDPDAAMLATAVPGETNKRKLSSNDIAGIRAAYPGAGSKYPFPTPGTTCVVNGGGQSCLAVHGQRGPGGLFSLLWLAWLVATLAVGRAKVKLEQPS